MNAKDYQLTSPRLPVAMGGILLAVFFLNRVVLGAELPEFKGSSELLNLVSLENQANNESILTWRGRVSLEEHRSYRGRPDRVYKSTVDFAIDRILDSKRWNWKCDESKLIDSGIERDGPGVGFHSGMIKDGAFYQLGPINESHRGRRIVIIADAKTFSFSPHATDFDPLYYLSDHGEPLWSRFREVYSGSFKGKAKGWKVSRGGQIITLEKTTGDIMNSYRVDLAQGANLISFESFDESVTESHTFEYEHVKGVWVPKYFSYENVNKAIGRTYSRTAKWITNVVNEPSDESLFSLASLGARERDRVKDLRKKEVK